MSLPEEEDRAVAGAIAFLFELSGLDSANKLPKIPLAIRTEAAKHWELLRVMGIPGYFSYKERQMILDDSRRFLLNLLWPKATPTIPKNVRKRAHNVTRHFPIIARKQA